MNIYFIYSKWSSLLPLDGIQFDGGAVPCAHSQRSDLPTEIYNLYISVDLPTPTCCQMILIRVENCVDFVTHKTHCCFNGIK